MRAVLGDYANAAITALRDARTYFREAYITNTGALFNGTQLPVDEVLNTQINPKLLTHFVDFNGNANPEKTDKFNAHLSQVRIANLGDMEWPKDHVQFSRCDFKDFDALNFKMGGATGEVLRRAIEKSHQHGNANTNLQDAFFAIGDVTKYLANLTRKEGSLNSEELDLACRLVTSSCSLLERNGYLRIENIKSQKNALAVSLESLLRAGKSWERPIPNSKEVEKIPLTLEIFKINTPKIETILGLKSAAKQESASQNAHSNNNHDASKSVTTQSADASGESKKTDPQKPEVPSSGAKEEAKETTAPAPQGALSNANSSTLLPAAKEEKKEPEAVAHIVENKDVTEKKLKSAAEEIQKDATKAKSDPVKGSATDEGKWAKKVSAEKLQKTPLQQAIDTLRSWNEDPQMTADALRAKRPEAVELIARAQLNKAALTKETTPLLMQEVTAYTKKSTINSDDLKKDVSAKLTDLRKDEKQKEVPPRK